MICDKCGRDIPDKSKFCTFCGDKKTPAPQEEITEPPAEAPVDPVADSPAESPAAPVAKPPAAPQGAPFPPPQEAAPVFTGEPPAGAFAPGQQTPDPSYSAQQPYPGAQYPDPNYSPNSQYPNPQYPGAQYQAAPYPEPPKKKKTWIIVVVIIAILLCCVAPVVTGIVLYNIGQNAIDNYTFSDALLEEYVAPDLNSDPTPNPSPNSNLDKVKSVEGTVLVDTSSVKITFGAGAWEEVLDWYELECTVENKTDKELFLYFDYDTSINGMDEAYSFIIYPAADNIEDFPAKAKTPGTLVFMDPPAGLDISTLKGTLIVVSIDDYSTVDEIPFDLSAK